MRKEAILHAYEKQQENVNANPIVPNVAHDTDLNVSLLQQAVFVEGVRPRQTYVYRPGSKETGPIVFGDFDELYKLALPNINMNIATTIVMDDSLENIVLNKTYNMAFFTFQGYKNDIFSHIKVTIGPNGQLINLVGLIQIDLYLDDSMTHTSLLYTTTNSRKARVFDMSYSNLRGLTIANITQNSPCIDVQAGTILQLNLQWNSQFMSIPQMNFGIPNDGFGYLRLNGGSGSGNTKVNISTIFNSSIHKSVFYASAGPNFIFEKSDSNSNPIIPPLTYPTNINFQPTFLSKASNILYNSNSAVVPSPAIANAVTVKEQIDAMANSQVDNTTHPFTKLVVQNNPNPAILVADSSNNNVDVGTNGVGTTTIASYDVVIGTSANGTTTMKSYDTEIGMSAFGITTLKSGTVNVGDSSSSIGFYGVPAVARQNASGFTTVADIVTALQNLGLFS